MIRKSIIRGYVGLLKDFHVPKKEIESAKEEMEKAKSELDAERIFKKYRNLKLE